MAATLATSVFLVAACGGGEPNSGSSTTGEPVVDGDFVTSVTGDPGNLDPHMSVLSLTQYVGTYMYDRLIYLDEDGQPQPWLAESWQVDDGSVTFTLQEGITCSDGAPLTASDVADNIGFVADPENQSPLLGVWLQPGVTASADDTARAVTVTAGQNDPFLLQGAGTLPIVCAGGLADREQLAQGGVGTGMFAMTEAVPDERYVFTRRDEYAWGPDGAMADDPGTPKTATIRIISNESTAANLFLAGELDLVSLTGPDQERLDAQNYDRYEARALYAELLFNQAQGRSGADPAVRKALVQAVDWQEMAVVTTGGRGVPAEGLGVMEPKLCPADTVSDSMPPHDPAAAAQALDAAGWTVADGVRSRDGDALSYTLAYNSEQGDQYAAGAELLAEQWRELGVEVELRPMTTVQVSEVLFGTGAWDAVIMTMNVSFPSQLMSFLSGPVPPDGTNFASLDNARYDDLTGDAMAQQGAEGCPQWDQAERALVAASDVTPFADTIVPYYVDNVELRMDAGNPAPATLRMFAP